MDKYYLSKQATINIGTIGHVAHGKTTIVRCISGTSTIKYKAELERNITINLGYANAKIYECDCPRPQKYGISEKKCASCSVQPRLIRHVSFVDCPGHDVLMATMLSGTAIMDAAILLIAANEPCPQPQTTEHVFALEIMDLKNIVIIQNKIDTVKKEQALEQYDQIKDFLKTSNVDGPIVPASGQFNVNIDAILDFIVNSIPVPERDLEAKPKMVIIRSFDINKPGTKVEDLNGGVIGGSLVAGVLRVGDEIEVKPGIVRKENGKFICQPFVTTITSLKAEKCALDEVVPGGLIGVGTEMDPSYCKSNWLVGMVMGLKGSLPPIYYRITVEFTLFEKTVAQSKEDLKENENLLLNVGSRTVGCIASEIKADTAVFDLNKPCCCEAGERIAISRKVKNNWRLIGYAVIKDGLETEIEY
ncbi:translation initiation factor 2 subunit 3 [Enteropsectra breve]|nr:translation initiation factor 2 subunit 3 [Enteropsectra breve]